MEIFKSANQKIKIIYIKDNDSGDYIQILEKTKGAWEGYDKRWSTLPDYLLLFDYNTYPSVDAAIDAIETATRRYDTENPA